MTILGRGNGRGKWCEVRVAKPPNDYEVQIVGIPQTEGTCSMIIKIVGMHYSFFWDTNVAMYSRNYRNGSHWRASNLAMLAISDSEINQAGHGTKNHI